MTKKSHVKNQQKVGSNISELNNDKESNKTQFKPLMTLLYEKKIIHFYFYDFCISNLDSFISILVTDMTWAR